jgi:hypothetical protein
LEPSRRFSIIRPKPCARGSASSVSELRVLIFNVPVVIYSRYESRLNYCRSSSVCSAFRLGLQRGSSEERYTGHVPGHTCHYYAKQRSISKSPTEDVVILKIASDYQPFTRLRRTSALRLVQTRYRRKRAAARVGIRHNTAPAGPQDR